MQLSEIVYALCNFPQLEKLVIDLRRWETADRTGLTDFEETFGHSNGIGYACLASHLKTAKIIGLSKENHKMEVVVQFVEFLLKNGITLEKVVVILRDGGFKFLAQVSQKLLKVPRCSTHCTVEVLSTCSEVKYCHL